MATVIQKAIDQAQKAFFKTDEGKALVANTVAATLTPEAMTEKIKAEMAGPTDTQDVFLKSVQDTNKSILDALGAVDTPAYVSGGTVQAATAPNYALYAIVALVIIVVVVSKGKIL
jgi:hypothetical protein